MNGRWRWVLVSLLAAATTWAGNQTGNGGDGLAERFVQRGYVILSILRTGKPAQTLLTPDQLALFEKKLHETRVAVIDTSDFRDNQGQPVEARNVVDPNRTDRRIIQLKKSAWQTYLSQGDSHIYQLVFHEYLLVMNVDDQNYVVSHLLSVNPVSGTSLTIRTCGLTGSVDERVLDCARPGDQGGFGDLAVKVMPTAEDQNDALSSFDDNPYFVWRLVARTENRDQFWRDETSHAIWSDRSANTFGKLEFASEYCGTVGLEIFHDAGIGFGMPSIHDFEDAIAHQIRSALPRMEQKYWCYDPNSINIFTHDAVFYGQLTSLKHPFYHYDDHPDLNTNYYGFYSDDYARCVAY